jgi:hypothetical protein
MMKVTDDRLLNKERNYIMMMSATIVGTNVMAMMMMMQ